MMKPFILTFDIGTSSCKAAAFSECGELLCTGRGSYGLMKPAEDRVEQSPEELWQGVCDALEALRGVCSLDCIQAIGISSQMAAHCLVDAAGKPLTNIISWMDRRAEAEVAEYNRQFSQSDTARLTEMDMLITPAHTITKLRWMKRNIPELLGKAAHLVQVKELILFRLTGRWVGDPTSYKGVVRQSTGVAIPEIMEFTGCSPDLLPEIGKPNECAGRLLANVRGFEGIHPGIPVAIGWNDMNAAYLGMAGLADDCIGLDLTGTSEHLGVMTGHFPEGFVCDGVNRVPFLNGREICYGVTSSGGQAFDWFVRSIFAHGDIQAAYAELLPRLDEISAQDIGELLFLPYIEGERNPWNAPNARGVFFGLNGGHNRLHMAKAVMEGVCFALRTIMERMPAKPRKIIVSGGSARNEAWNRMKADVMQIPYEKLHTTEAGCNGAAILALSCLRPEQPLQEIAAGMTRTVVGYAPDPGIAAHYDRKYDRYLALYEHLQPDFERIKQG